MHFSKLKWLAAFLAVAALLWASGIAPSAYNTIISGSSTLASRSVLKFTNGGCVDNSGTTPPETDCTIGGVLFSQTQTVTDAIQTTETTLVGTGSGSTGIPANFYAAGTTVKFEASGVYSTTASPGTLTIRVKHSGGATGTVVVGTTGAMTPLASITNGVWRLWGNITFRTAGAGGTGIMNTVWEGEPSSLSALTPADASIVNTAVFTVDTTAIQTVDLTAAWSAAGQSISCTNLIVYSPNGSSGGGGGGSFTAAVPYLSNGSNFFAPTFAVTKPIPGNFTWQNQGGATNTTTANGALYLLGTQQSGDQLRFFEETCPAATYTLTVQIIPQLSNVTFQHVGFGVRDPGSGRIQEITVQNGADISVQNFNTFSSFNARPVDFGAVIPQVVSLRVANNSTNLIYSWSTDGVTFATILTDPLSGGFINTTPTQCGFFLDGNATGTGLINATTVLGLLQGP